MAVQAQLIIGCLIAFAGDTAEVRVHPEALQLWERYRHEAPQTAALLETVNVRLRCRSAGPYSASTQQPGSANSLSPDATTSESTFAGGFMKRIGVDSRGIETVMAVNDVYAFEITRGSGSDQYAIHWLEPLKNWTAGEETIAFHKAEALAGAFGYWYVFGIPFFELATNTSCQVKDVLTEMKGGRALLRVEFETPREGWSPSKNFVLLDPERGFAPVETGSVYQANRDHPERTSQYVASIEFGEPVGGLPIARRKTETWTSKDWLRGGPDIVQKATTTFEVLDSADISTEEFYLKFYGLPEPYFQRRWLRSFWTYLFGAIVCLAVVYALRRRRATA